MTLTVTVPLPPRECSPNGRHHWRAKAKAVKAYRTVVTSRAFETLENNSLACPKWKRATVRAAFYFKQDRRRDGDNLLASLKAAFDGIRDAGIIDDDSGLTHEPVAVAKDTKNPRVVLTIRELPAPAGGGGGGA